MGVQFPRRASCSTWARAMKPTLKGNSPRRSDDIFWCSAGSPWAGGAILHFCSGFLTLGHIFLYSSFFFTFTPCFCFVITKLMHLSMDNWIKWAHHLVSCSKIEASKKAVISTCPSPVHPSKELKGIPERDRNHTGDPPLTIHFRYWPPCTYNGRCPTLV